MTRDGRGPSDRPDSDILCIADRFSGYVWAKQLKGAGESGQIIRVIMDSLGGLFLGTRRINSDNASNFVSYEFVNWANRFNIVLDNSAGWNLSLIHI